MPPSDRWALVPPQGGHRTPKPSSLSSPTTPTPARLSGNPQTSEDREELSSMSQCHLAAPTWTRLHTRLGWCATRAGDLWGHVLGGPHPSLGFPWGLPSASILRGKK